MALAGPGNTDLHEVDVVAPCLNRRYSGVTSTVVALLPEQAKTLRIAALGHHIPAAFPHIGWLDILRRGWTRPTGRDWRIWHARRNVEMAAGVALRDLLRQPWKLVFTSSAQRDHKALTKWLIRRMDAVIATSPQAAAFLRVPATIIMHGVDLERHRPAADRGASWAETGLPGRYGIGAFGRVRHQKGTDTFVEAMCRLLPRHPDFTAVIVGLAKAGDAAFVKRLKARIDRAGLRARIVFLGEMPSGDIPAWFSRVLIHVAPQRSEGFGLTPLEAMASGTAVVALRVGVFETLIEDGETGLVVDGRTVEPLIEALDGLMAAPERAAAMGEAGRRRAEARFAVSDEARSIGAVYDDLWRTPKTSGADHGSER